MHNWSIDTGRSVYLYRSLPPVVMNFLLTKCHFTCARVCVCVTEIEKVGQGESFELVFFRSNRFFRFPAKTASRISVVSVNPIR